jgi:hypothetical protein
MRYAVRNCSTPTDHAMHHTVSGPSRDFEDDRTTYVCPGGRAGDRRLREYDGSLADLVLELERAQEEDSVPTSGGGPDVPWWTVEPPSPTSRRDDEYDAGLDVEPDDDYSQSDLDYFADRAADRYERNVLGL